MCSLSLLQGIFPIQGLKPGLPHCRRILYQLSYQGSPNRVKSGIKGASLVAQMVKRLPAMWETQVQSLGWEGPLEKGMATHSSTLAWKIPWTEELWRSLEGYSPWNYPGQNTAVGSLSPLQEIFPTQGLKSGLPHCRWILYQLSEKESPRILEWVAHPFSSGFSRPRN